jgi:short-subunit dehydrogenase
MLTPFEYRGRTALITGASSGIGAEFARALAQRGMNQVLVARSEDKLRALRTEVLQKHADLRVEVVTADLSQRGAGAGVHARTEQLGLTVDLLVNNAGFGTMGAFGTLPWERERDEIMVNVVGVVELTRLFLPGMLARGGGVINVASVAAFQPFPYMAVYGATKAFVLSFSEALAAECRDRGVRILALCPGPVETPFFDHVPPTDVLRSRDTPQHVVMAGLKAFDGGRGYYIPRMRDYVLAQMSRLLPRFVLPKVLARRMKQRGSS